MRIKEVTRWIIAELIILAGIFGALSHLHLYPLASDSHFYVSHPAQNVNKDVREREYSKYNKYKYKYIFLYKSHVTFYDKKFENHIMKNGRRFHEAIESAASNSLPLGTRLRLYYPATGHYVIVTITDTGSGIVRNGLDLSMAAYDKLGLSRHNGVGKVKVEIVKTWR